MDNSTIELVTFRARQGVTNQQLETQGAALEGFLKEQPGFLYRSLSVDEDGLWYDIVYWKTMSDAESAAEKFKQNQLGMAMMELIDMDSARMRHMVASHEAMYETATQETEQ